MQSKLSEIEIETNELQRIGNLKNGGKINLDNNVYNWPKKVHYFSKEARTITALFFLGLCDVYYGGKCYIAILTTSDFSEGVYRCGIIGGQAANIYNSDHHAMIVKYIRANHMAQRSHTQLWIGMTISLKVCVIFV